MNIKILADSTCDLPKELVEKHNITIVPLTVIKNGESFSDGITISPSDIFSHVANGGSLCSTAAVSVGEYADRFEKFSGSYDAVFHINISSEFSCSYQNACLAAADYDNVYVIDSRNLSTGQGLVVLKACKMAETCSDPAQMQKELQDFTEKIEASFVLDRLEYMVKGGRCSTAKALGANLLNLKPCIEVKDGKMSVVKKYRGNFNKSLTAYVKDRLTGRDDLDLDTLFITYTVVNDETLQAVNDIIREHCNFQNVYCYTAGCTVSCHCGPGTLGLLFVKK